jgi:transcriptional regulator with XRE-family HTH domain
MTPEQAGYSTFGVGARIAKCVSESGKTLSELSRNAEVDLRQIRRYVCPTDRRQPNIETLAKLAVALDVTTDHLLGIGDRA